MTLSCVQRRFPIFGLGLFVILFLLPNSAHAQKVANYSFGKAGTKSYERLSFWVQGDERGEIIYSYGKGSKESTVSYVARDLLHGAPCFKIQFSNGHVFYVVPKGGSLKVVAGEGRYSKVFRWEYEGPVNGRGTWCEPCAEDATEAMGIIRKYYMK